MSLPLRRAYAARYGAVQDFRMRDDRSDGIGFINRHEIGRPFGEIVETVKLSRIHGPQHEMPVCETLDASRAVELRPLGAQTRTRLLLVPDVETPLGNALRLAG